MEAVKSSSSDFKTICRTCLCDVKQILAFHIDSVVTHQDPIGEILSRTTSKQVSSGDALPKQLCETCVADLTRCYNFISRFRASQQKLLAVANAAVKKEEVVVKQEPIESQEVTNIDEKPFLCPTCGKAFQQQNLLAEHTKSHKNARYKCWLCEKTFALKTALIMHEKAHKGHSVCRCLVCQKGATNGSTVCMRKRRE